MAVYGYTSGGKCIRALPMVERFLSPVVFLPEIQNFSSTFDKSQIATCAGEIGELDWY